jgi:hypothetical protein
MRRVLGTLGRVLLGVILVMMRLIRWLFRMVFRFVM